MSCRTIIKYIWVFMISEAYSTECTYSLGRLHVHLLLISLPTGYIYNTYSTVVTVVAQVIFIYNYIYIYIYTCDIGLFVGQYFDIHYRLSLLPIFACDMCSADIYTSNIGWQACCTNNRYRLYLLYHNFGGFMQFENLRSQL